MTEEPIRIRHTDSNRIGIFNITKEMQQDRELIAALMRLCVVLEAGPHPSGRGTAYIAESAELFQPLQPGEEIPQYRIVFDHPSLPLPPEEAALCTAKSGLFRFRAVRNTIVRVPPLEMRYSGHGPQSVH